MATIAPCFASFAGPLEFTAADLPLIQKAIREREERLERKAQARQERENENPSNPSSADDGDTRKEPRS